MMKLLKKIRFTTIVLILGAALIVSSVFSLLTIQNLEGNARVINYTGIVRGATQRLVKQELNNEQNDQLIARLDVILEELQNGGEKNRLIRLDDDAYQALVNQLQNKWAALKNEIYNYRAGGTAEGLYKISEEYFEMADQTVSAAEQYTEQAVRSAKYFLLLVTLIFLGMVVACAFFASSQQKRREKLLADEKESLERQIHLNQMLNDIRAPLDELPELMYISDLETYDLLFINKAGRDTFNFKDTERKKCYEVLQGLDAPCPFCSTPMLKPEEYYNWEHTNPVTGKHYLLKDRLIEWEGRSARFEIAFDLTEAMKEKQNLKNMLETEQVIVECIRDLYQNHDLTQAIPLFLERVGNFIQADRSYIFDLRGDYFKNTYEWCADGVVPEQENLQNIPNAYIDRWLKAFEEQECMVVEDCETIKSIAPDEYELLAAQSIERFVVVPLERDGELYACVGVDNPPLEMMQNATSILQTLRYFLMLAIRRTEDEAELAKLSYYDTLTSFYNRNRYIQDLEAFASYEGPVGVVFLDVNGLKAVNDQYGHGKGDQLLEECARCIREGFGESNFYRVGGDEFVVLSTGDSEAVFLERTERLRAYFDRVSCISAAIGACWTRQGAGIDAAVAAADERMYADKQAFYHEHQLSKRYRYMNDTASHAPEEPEEEK
ncbi:diguanylate cyclase [Eubacterium sp. 1001713B170207_170306_E7]|uniref:sensor domain-containing diguanylate cyclase n=1 Tax=Eubacterium sp. 1001713B170207_170306_E7 TaxID=2787097 RepID=UPI001897C2A5|nr:diguanylate cyclase [Eubacterium sp. 1001713B170207_170306_E7]